MRYIKVTTYDKDAGHLIVVHVETDRDDERTIEILQEIHPEWEAINLRPVETS